MKLCAHDMSEVKSAIRRMITTVRYRFKKPEPLDPSKIIAGNLYECMGEPMKTTINAWIGAIEDPMIKRARRRQKMRQIIGDILLIGATLSAMLVAYNVALHPFRRRKTHKDGKESKK